MSKGSKRRPENWEKFNINYSKVFGKHTKKSIGGMKKDYNKLK
tara:strand:- start:5 stop:133 length:129 start_codon:yes stop_codon:yes gene_type:complete